MDNGLNKENDTPSAAAITEQNNAIIGEQSTDIERGQQHEQHVVRQLAETAGLAMTIEAPISKDQISITKSVDGFIEFNGRKIELDKNESAIWDILVSRQGQRTKASDFIEQGFGARFNNKNDVLHEFYRVMRELIEFFDTEFKRSVIIVDESKKKSYLFAKNIIVSPQDETTTQTIDKPKTPSPFAIPNAPRQVNSQGSSDLNQRLSKLGLSSDNPSHRP